jgi:hypothetical protein
MIPTEDENLCMIDSEHINPLAAVGLQTHMDSSLLEEWNMSEN